MSNREANVKLYMTSEWLVERVIDKPHPLLCQYEITTKNRFDRLKKNGQPRKLGGGRRCVFACHDKLLAEHICLLHNMNLREDAEPLHELIDRVFKSAKEHILYIAKPPRFIPATPQQHPEASSHHPH